MVDTLLQAARTAAHVAWPVNAIAVNLQAACTAAHSINSLSVSPFFLQAARTAAHERQYAFSTLPSLQAARTAEHCKQKSVICILVGLTVLIRLSPKPCACPNKWPVFPPIGTDTANPWSTERSRDPLSALNYPLPRTLGSQPDKHGTNLENIIRLYFCFVQNLVGTEPTTEPNHRVDASSPAFFGTPHRRRCCCHGRVWWRRHSPKRIR